MSGDIRDFHIHWTQESDVTLGDVTHKGNVYYQGENIAVVGVYDLNYTLLQEIIFFNEEDKVFIESLRILIEEYIKQFEEDEHETYATKES